MKSFIIKSLTAVILLFCFSPAIMAESVRKERQLISAGNKLFKEGKYADAAKKYEEALKVNGSSAVGKYNLGISRIKQVTNPKDTTQRNRGLLDSARANLTEVVSIGVEKPDLASKAAYNLGNLAFNVEDFQNAVVFYKESLRFNPNDETTRRNLRIAQKKLQNQNNQEQNKDKDKDKDKNKDQNKDQQQNQSNDQKQDQKQPPKENNISPQTADQILQAVDNKESQTRQRFNVSKGEKAKDKGRNTKRW